MPTTEDAGALILTVVRSGEVGLDVVGLDVLGLDVLGLDVLGLDVLGLDVLGSDVLGSDVLGSDVLGSDVFETEVVETAVEVVEVDVGVWFAAERLGAAKVIRPARRASAVSRIMSAKVRPITTPCALLVGNVLRSSAC